MFDTIIIGAGPGGLQAGIAAASEGMKVLIVEKGNGGGQIGQTPRLENSVFSHGMSGPDFANMMYLQAKQMGCTFLQESVDGLHRLKSGNWRVTFATNGWDDCGVRIATGQTIILAMGRRWVDPAIPGTAALMGKRVHMGPVKSLNYNATGRRVMVYGGGPSAGQAILELADSVNCAGVDAVMRTKLNMPEYLVERIEKHGNVTVHKHTTLTNVVKDSHGLLACYTDRHTIGPGFQVDAIFLCNGLKADTDWLEGVVPLDEDGRVLTSLPSLQTSVQGIYAIGDVRSGSTPRVGVAIGDGSMVVTELWEHFGETKSCHSCKKIMA